MRRLPALVHDHRKTQITDTELLTDDRHGHDVGPCAAEFLGDAQGAQAERVGRADPVPRNAFFCSGQAVAPQDVGADDLFDKVARDVAPAQLFLGEMEIHGMPPC